MTRGCWELFGLLSRAISRDLFGPLILASTARHEWSSESLFSVLFFLFILFIFPLESFTINPLSIYIFTVRIPFNYFLVYIGFLYFYINNSFIISHDNNNSMTWKNGKKFITNDIILIYTIYYPCDFSSGIFLRTSLISDV